MDYTLNFDHYDMAGILLAAVLTSEYFLEAKPVDKTHRTSEVAAIMRGAPLVSDCVLEHGLHAAVGNFDRQIVQLLLEYGTDPNYAYYDQTSLTLIPSRVDESLGRLLIDYGAHPYVFVENQVVHYSKRLNVINRTHNQRADRAAYRRE